MLTCSAQVNVLSGGGMSTQEKVHGLGLKVPDLNPYASGSRILCEGDGALVVVKIEGAAEGLPHNPQVLLQLALHSRMGIDLQAPSTQGAGCNRVHLR